MRMVKEGKGRVYVRTGNRAFLDTDCPFPEHWQEDIMARQQAYEEVETYLDNVYKFLRQGANWEHVEVPECLEKLGRERPAAQPDEQATAATSRKKSATSLAAERRLSMSRGQSST